MADSFNITGKLILTGVDVNQAFGELNRRLREIPSAPLKQLNQNTKEAVQNTNELEKGQQKLSRSTNRTAREFKQSASAIQDFGDKAGLALRRFTAFSIAAGGVFGSLRALRSGISDALKFNRELVRVAQVTGNTVESLGNLRREIGSLSVEFGASSQDLVGVARTLSQAGLTAKETQKALSALAATTLAPTFTDISKTTEGAIASLRQFNLRADELGRTFGIINAVAGKFAVESDDIITAIRKAGSAFSSASQGISEGNDALAEFVALFTSVRATTRESADTIGTGLRTIFTRIQRPETINFLRQFGVELTDITGKFVGPFQAVQRLGVALRNLSPRDTRFATIVEEIGGFRQVSRVIPLLQQTRLQNEALNVALEGQNSIARDVTVAQKDLSVQIDQTRQQFATLLRDIANTETFQTFIKLSLDLASALLNVADSAKELIPVIGAVVGLRGLVGVASALPSFGARAITGSAAIRARGRQTGGFVPGVGDGDKVPAMLEPGEFVLNKIAVAKVGAKNLEKLNSAIPRFGGVQYAQKGGIIGLQRGGRRGRNIKNFDDLESVIKSTFVPSDQPVDPTFFKSQPQAPLTNIITNDNATIRNIDKITGTYVKSAQNLKVNVEDINKTVKDLTLGQKKLKFVGLDAYTSVLKQAEKVDNTLRGGGTSSGSLGIPLTSKQVRQDVIETFKDIGRQQRAQRAIQARLAVPVGPPTPGFNFQQNPQRLLAAPLDDIAATARRFEERILRTERLLGRPNAPRMVGRFESLPSVPFSQSLEGQVRAVQNPFLAIPTLPIAESLESLSQSRRGPGVPVGRPTSPITVPPTNQRLLTGTPRLALPSFIPSTERRGTTPFTPLPRNRSLVPTSIFPNNVNVSPLSLLLADQDFEARQRADAARQSRSRRRAAARERFIRSFGGRNFTDLSPRRAAQISTLSLGIGLLNSQSDTVEGKTLTGAGFGGSLGVGLGLGIPGVIGAAAVGGSSAFLSAKQEELTSESLKNLEKSTNELNKAFKTLTVSATDREEIGIKSADVFNRISNFREIQTARDKATVGGLASTFTAGGLSDGDVNARIRQARGTANFFFSRLNDTFIPSERSTEIQREDIRALKRLDIKEAQERADLAAEPAAEARQKIIEQIRSGVSASDIETGLLQLSQADNVDVQRGTALNAKFLGQAFAENVEKTLKEEARVRDNIINSLRTFQAGIDDVSSRIGQASAILDVLSEVNALRSSNARAFASGDTRDFRATEFFSNTKAFSRDQLLSGVRRTESVVGRRLNPDIVNRALSLSDLNKQITDLEFRESAGEDVKDDLERVKLQAEAAEESVEALNKFEKSVNQVIGTLQEELSFRRNLVRQSTDLGLSSITAAGAFQEARAGLIGRDDRFVGRGQILNAQVQSLTGGPTEVADILDNIRSINESRARNAQNSKDPIAAAIKDSRLVENLERNTKALDLLSSDISELSDIQNKLSEIQQQREAGGALIEDAFGLNFTQQRERARQLSAFNIFQQNQGNLGAVAAAGFTNQDVLAGFRLRQQTEGLNPDAAERESVIFRQNILRSQGINNFRDLQERFGADTAERLRPSLNVRGGDPRERKLLEEADKIGQRQLDAINAQKALVDQTIAQFNADVITGLGQNIAGLKEAAQALNTDIQVTFKPINVTVDLGQNFNELNQTLTNNIMEQVRVEINNKFDQFRGGNGLQPPN